MKKIFLMAAMAAAAVACNNMEQIQKPAENASFVASIAQTKTALVDNVKTHWVAEDAISVFGAEGTNYWYATTDSGETVIFDQTGTAEIEEGLVTSMPYALYPYNYEAVIDGTTITTSIQKDQYAVVGNFPSNQKPLLVAQSDATGKLAFQHASSVIKFTLTDETIEWIYIKGNDGEKLTGTTVVSTDGSDTVIDGSWTETTATLKNEDGTPLAAGTYYLVMGPTEFASGITVEWGPTVEGYTNWKYTGNPVSAKMGHILNLGTLAYVETDSTAPAVTALSEYNITATVGSGKTVSVTATDEKELASVTCMLYTSDWSTVLDTEVIPASGTEATVEYTLTYDTPGDYLFVSYATDAAGNDSGWWYTLVNIIEATSDAEAPVMTITSGDAVAGEVYSFVLNFSDESGISTCWPQVYLATSDWALYPSLSGSLPAGYWANNGNANWGATVEGTSFDFTLDLIFQFAGTYNVYVWGPVSDKSGNGYGAEEIYVGSITVTEAAE